MQIIKLITICYQHTMVVLRVSAVIKAAVSEIKHSTERKVADEMLSTLQKCIHVPSSHSPNGL